MGFYDLFLNPGKQFRGKPFWSWNGRLEPEEIRRQVRILQRMGMGGGFLHSRIGLATRYLGEEWFECIKAATDECRKLDMEAWLYDEDRWPSGSAGGLATRKKSCRAKLLLMEIIPPDLYDGPRGALGVWQARIEGDKAFDIKPIDRTKNAKSAGPGISILRIRAKEMPSSSWYNGSTYLDTLSKEAVREFIRITHQQYKKETGKEFGKTILGIFTDEPNHYECGLAYQRSSEASKEIKASYNPWTPHLPRLFKKQFGYDLIPHLPELFLYVEGEKISRARWHYRDLVTHLFVDSFARQICEWCGKNNIAFTGHILLESDLRQQTAFVGSTQRFYEHMQVPGVDILTDQRGGYEYDTVKQCASVMNQTDRRWMLSELYGCTGWDFTFEGHKAVGDWQAALGVSLRCQHLSWYTMQGEAKRDYPASIFFQSPWWEHYRAVEDYFSRLNVALTRGRPVRRLLVIHPIETMWARFVPQRTGEEGFVNCYQETRAEIGEINRLIADARTWLLEDHIDYDLADEEMLGRLGRVLKPEKAPGCGARLKLGKADYDVVLVPPLETIRSSTLTLLERFQAAGGTVVFSGNAPKHVDAAQSDRARQIADTCMRVPYERGAVIQALNKSAQRIFITSPDGKEISSILYMLREEKAGEGSRDALGKMIPGSKESDAGTILFLCNINRVEARHNVHVAVHASGSVVEWDCETGERRRIPSKKEGGRLIFETSLFASGSRLFVIGKNVQKGILPKPSWKILSTVPLNSITEVQLTEPNTLVLDRAEFRIAGGEWQQATEILRIDRAMRDHLKIPYRGGAMTQPWAYKPPANEKKARMELKYSFRIETLPAKGLYLALETLDQYGSIMINDCALSPDAADGWWVDPCLKRIPVDPAILKTGMNELRLAMEYGSTSGLEACFILGDFGVSLENGLDSVITAQQKSLSIGDITTQGLPFYSGAVIYRFRANMDPAGGGKCVVLSAPQFKGAVVRVLVDGKEVGYISWPPYELDISRFVLGKKEAIITLEIFLSRRNAFGPLHQKTADPPWVGPDSFLTQGDDWSEAYVLKSCGLLEAPTIVFKG